MCVGDPLSLLTLSLSHALYLPRAVSPSHIPVWSVSKLEDYFSWTVQFVVERERRGRRRKKELCVAEKLLQTRIFVKTKDSSYHRRLFNRTCFQLQEKTTIVQFYLSNRQHTNNLELRNNIFRQKEGKSEIETGRKNFVIFRNRSKIVFQLLRCMATSLPTYLHSNVQTSIYTGRHRTIHPMVRGSHIVYLH